MTEPQRTPVLDPDDAAGGPTPPTAAPMRLHEVRPPEQRSADAHPSDLPRTDAPEAREPTDSPRHDAPNGPDRVAPRRSAAAPDGASGPARAGSDDRRRRVRTLMFAALPVALVIGGWLYVTGGAVVSSDNAYVQADKVAISTDVSGIVKRVDVTDNQRVAAGDLLFELDDEPFRLALTRAQANLAIVRDQIAALKASYRDMQAQIAQAKADVDFYTREFDRQKALVARNVASEQAFDSAHHNLEVAQQKVASLGQQLAGIAANLNQNPDIAVKDHPRYVDAKAQRDEAARQLAHTRVKAPFAGVVTNVPSLQPGQYLAAATSAFSLVATDHVWVESNPKETELTHVSPGQPVTVTVDTYPGVEWHGSVASISPASGSSFSLLPAQNTSGNWVKVVQRIPIRVKLDTPGDKPHLRVGMSVTIDVDTGHPRGLPMFVKNLFGGTAVAAPATPAETAPAAASGDRSDG
ncbi:HlyD family secretion protein [Rhodovulum sp. PH10]|uniref:HlyD family secretion protein n=1 Tax=Rhodovulum sp. PH10 TaxID=1187851 RepID=UPI00192B2AF7|nr:HlyD family secretion protein [Rhodovulum sp. PH10]